MLCRKTPRRLVTPQFISPVVSCSLALAAASSATAANWEVAPRVEAGYRYSDNYHLGPPGTEVEVSGGEADAQVTFRSLDPRTQIEITPRIQATYFPDEPEDDSVDYFLDGSVVDKTPRRRMGVVGEFSRQDVARSELPGGDVDSGDLGDPVQGDSGRFVEHNRRNYARIAPFFRYDVTQRQRLELDAHYLRADFEKQFEGAQQDFSEAGVSAGWGYQFTERSSLMFRALASQYETTFDTDAYGGLCPVGHELHRELARLRACGCAADGTGERRDRHQRDCRPRRQLEQPAQHAVPRPDPHCRAHFGGNRSRALPVAYADSPRGVAARLTDARSARRRATRKSMSRAHSRRASTRRPKAGFEWRVLRNFAVTATYSYRWQEYADELSDRSANGFLIGLVYEPKRLD